MKSNYKTSSLVKRSWYVPQTLGLRPLDLSNLTAPSIGYKTEGQRQAINEMRASVDVLASVSLETHIADLVSRKILFDFKTTSRGFAYCVNANPFYLKGFFFPIQTSSALIIYDVKIYVTV